MKRPRDSPGRSLRAVLAALALSVPAGLGASERFWSSEEGLPAQPIVAMAQDGLGFLWLATAADLLRWDGVRLLTAAGVPAAHWSSLAAAGDGTVWAVTVEGDLWRATADGSHLRLEQKAKAGHRARDLYADGTGALWIGGDGLHLLGREGDRRTLLAGLEVLALHGDSLGALWAGTATGLWRVAGDQATSVPVPGGPSAPLAMLGETAHGELVLAYGAQGVWLANGLGGLSARTERLSSLDAAALATDRWGTLWAGERGRVTALLRDREGSLWAAAFSGGLRQLREPVPAARPAAAAGLVPLVGAPASRAAAGSAPAPAPSIEALWSDAERVPLDRPAVVAGRRLRIEFAAPTFIAPQRLEYRYRLRRESAGDDSGWIESGAGRSATWSDPPAGPLILEVQARYPEATWSSPARVRVSVERSAAGATRRAAPWVAVPAVLAAALLAITLRRRRRRRADRTDWAPEIDSFLTDFSHELRTPMTLVLGPIENALEGLYGELVPELRRALATARQNALRQLRLVNQFLGLARLDTGGFQLALARVDLEALLAGTVAAFSSLAERRNISLALHDSPAPVIWADPDLLEQVFSNLLSNALKFTPRGGRVEVRLGSQSAEHGGPERVEVTVADDGPAIPAEALPRLFERFYRAPGARSSVGTGVGLALVRRIVDLHHGSIEARSGSAGNEFVVALRTGREHFGDRGWALIERPRDAVSHETLLEVSVTEAGEEPDRPTPPPQPAAVETGRPLLLLVDDHPAMLRHLRETLGQEYRYAEARDGEEALRLLASIEPEVVVSDVVMPQVDGFELCRRIRQDPELDHLTVLLLTARGELGDRLAGLEHGADDYLAKPFQRRELVARIANLVARRRRLRERWQRPGATRAEESDAPPAEREFMRRVLAVIDQRLGDESLSIPALASALAVSTRSLQRKLKAITGAGPLELVHTVRLERAATLLDAGACNVAEAGYRVGFSDPGTFSKAFRRHFGHPPSDRAPGRT